MKDILKKERHKDQKGKIKLFTYDITIAISKSTGKQLKLICELRSSLTTKSIQKSNVFIYQQLGREI